MAVSKIPGAGISGGSVTVSQTAPDNSLVINSSGNVGIGTSSPSYKLHVANNYGFFSGANYGVILGEDNCLIAGTSATLNSANMVFYTANTERMRIDSSGNLAVGTATPLSSRVTVAYSSGSGAGIIINQTNAGVAGNLMSFRLNNIEVGSIYQNTANTSYITSSDYRLKENVAPMTGALAKVAQLKPCTYTWKATGEAGEGFIAHELQAVVPDAVVGEKDAVDEEGNIKPQGIDTSFLVATLTAAIQELKAELDATKAEVQALKGAN